jgi:hypothetical protein
MTVDRGRPQAAAGTAAPKEEQVAPTGTPAAAVTWRLDGDVLWALLNRASSRNAINVAINAIAPRARTPMSDAALASCPDAEASIASPPSTWPQSWHGWRQTQPATRPARCSSFTAQACRSCSPGRLATSSLAKALDRQRAAGTVRRPVPRRRAPPAHRPHRPALHARQPDASSRRMSLGPTHRPGPGWSRDDRRRRLRPDAGL